MYTIYSPAAYFFQWFLAGVNFKIAQQLSDDLADISLQDLKLFPTADIGLLISLVIINLTFLLGIQQVEFPFILSSFQPRIINWAETESLAKKSVSEICD